MLTPRRRRSGNVTMGEETHQTRIYRDPRDPDVLVVLASNSAPGTIPVIPTTEARTYWAHPSQSGGPRRTHIATDRSTASAGVGKHRGLGGDPRYKSMGGGT